MKLNDGNGTPVKSNSCSLEYKIKRCLKLLFLHLRRQAICTILRDLCKQEAAFIAGLDFTRGQPERYKNVL